MSQHSTDLSSSQIKSYVEKLYSEIVGEIDTFLDKRDLPSSAPPISPFPSGPLREKERWTLKRPVLQQGTFSFSSQSSDVRRRPSSRFLSSFGEKGVDSGFDSRKYFSSQLAFETSKREVCAPPVAWNHIWESPLREAPAADSAPKEKGEKPALFDETTKTIIPSLRSTIDTILGTKKEGSTYTQPKAETTRESDPRGKLKDAFFKTPETIKSEVEMDDLVTPLAGMVESTTEAKQEMSVLPVEVKEEPVALDIQTQIKQFIEESKDQVFQENFWQSLEAEESLEDLFANTEQLGENSEEPEEKVDTALVMECEPVRESISSDPFFLALETAFQTTTLQPEPGVITPVMNLEEATSSEKPAEKEVSTMTSLPFDLFKNARLGSLAWAGEVRWYLVARGDLREFKESLPEGFSVCNGTQTPGTIGSLSVTPSEIKGKLPLWTETYDKDHVVVGVIRLVKDPM